MATPFVQGRLRGRKLSITVKTSCACCNEPMELEIDSDMNIHGRPDEIDPIIFIPDVDLMALDEPNIISSF